MAPFYEEYIIYYIYIYIIYIYIHTILVAQFSFSNKVPMAYHSYYLNTPADADLSRCASILLCHLDNGGTGQGLTLSQWAVALKCNALVTTVLDQLFGLLERMILHLMEYQSCL